MFTLQMMPKLFDLNKMNNTGIVVEPAKVLQELPVVRRKLIIQRPERMRHTTPEIVGLYREWREVHDKISTARGA